MVAETEVEVETTRKTKYVNVLTGQSVWLDYVPVGAAWRRRPDEKLKKRLLREERARVNPKKEIS